MVPATAPTRATRPRPIVPDPPWRGPIEVGPGSQAERWSASAVASATWAFVGLGVFLRLTRFLLGHPLWGDESALAANYLDRGYLGLLGPLDFQQVAPVLFLWVELTAVKALGFSEWSLRAFPTACAVAGMFLFRHAAARLIRGFPLVLAVAILAVSTYPIRHGGEAKPYGSDFLVSLGLVAMAIEWWRDPRRSRWLWALAAAIPAAMGLSYPSAFVGGGIALAMAPEVVRARRSDVAGAYAAFLVSMVASFGAVLAASAGAQGAHVGDFMANYWAPFFPPIGEPARLALWLVRAHSGYLFAYPVGGSWGASGLTIAAVVAGVLAFRQRGGGAIVGLLIAPLGLALAAAAAHRYPYGDNARIMQFAGPMTCLTAGLGGGVLLGRLRRPGSYRRATVAVAAGLGILGLGEFGADVLMPAKTPHDLRAREFARWFWSEAGRDAELACAHVDLGLDFQGTPSHYGRLSDYLCARAIYRDRRGLDWSRLTGSHPLRCVLNDGVPADSPLFERWMAGMNRHYRLVRTETFRANAGVAPSGVTFEDHLAVLEFVPRGRPVGPARIARGAIAAE